MAADQNLIRAVSAMGPSKFRDDRGWIKAIGAIGKYVATKQAIFKEGNESFDENSGFAEDIDSEALKTYQETSDANLKTIKNVPAFLPKYKKAVASQNAIYKELELNKSNSAAFADLKVQAANAKFDNISNYRKSKYAVLYADLISENYVYKMSSDGGTITGSNGVEVLVSDLLESSKPRLVTDSKASNDIINGITTKFGVEAKLAGKDIATETVGNQINKAVDDMWIVGNDNTTILYNTNYATSGGEMTFMDYYAQKKGVDKMMSGTMTYGMLSEEALDATLSLAKDDLWENGNQKEIKAAYKDFLLNEVTMHEYNINETPKRDVNGRTIPNPNKALGVSRFDDSKSQIDRKFSEVKLKSEKIQNVVEGNVINYWTGSHNQFKVEPMKDPRTDQTLKDKNGKTILGWQLYQGGVKSTNPQFKNPYSVQELHLVFNIDMAEDKLNPNN